MALLLCSTGAFGSALSPKAHLNASDLVKGTNQPVAPPIHIDQGGDTIATAFVIGSLPFSDSGTTAGYADNYAPNCGFAGGAPDVVYKLVAGSTIAVDIALCGSTYDTEVYVYQDSVGNIIGCNDDSCGLQSQLLGLTLPGGHTYYIIVDGYSSASGAYTINVTANVPCIVACPAGGLLEGEPVCSDNYYDSYNGGCNSVPPVFSALPLANETVCGTYGGFFYNGLSYRDTDWYQIVIPAGPARAVTWTVRGETDTLCGIINGSAGCPVSSFYAFAYGAKCTDLVAAATLAPGTWWLWVGTLNFGTVAGPCGQHYNGTLTCQACGPVAVEPATWGSIKNMYK
jgi:hypothetical protein